MFYSRKHLVLPGYRLKFNKIVSMKNAGAANIIPDQNGLVEGVLYKITLQGITNLDKYEHYPDEYDRVILRVPGISGNHVEITTYIAQHSKTSVGLKPRKEYLDHLLAAEDLLSSDYYNLLKTVKTID